MGAELGFNANGDCVMLLQSLGRLGLVTIIICITTIIFVLRVEFPWARKAFDQRRYFLIISRGRSLNFEKSSIQPRNSRISDPRIGIEADDDVRQCRTEEKRKQSAVVVLTVIILEIDLHSRAQHVNVDSVFEPHRWRS
ncbi:hypothetical protein SISSUDRAFT_1054730 [Sistotremastrum suecicum HHB10207 ss-3]|uniref:Uncharacterized protein n=1 Tax=Sistotremastrum suecicum HHB10207 ss-3 TaxID=1314776 RepID=A0A165Y9C9_9AGAM|nr:hypothetical protein SISSUDRAFT_1054730 [Sistotremastrum suecicum HHB10207 ss-3]